MLTASGVPSVSAGAIQGFGIGTLDGSSAGVADVPRVSAVAVEPGKKDLDVDV